MTREFKVDMVLAREMAQFLETLLEAELNEEFDADQPCTDTYLDQFDPNGFVPFNQLMQALIKAGVVIPQIAPEQGIGLDNLQRRFQ
jgi:hypothetical protein